MVQSYVPEEVEKEILEFWKKEEIYEKLRAKNKEGKHFTFLQGPPYTSGRIHVGTAWNSSLKDTILRYKRMQGFDCWDRHGYDVHGLPTEHKVQDKFNLPFKEDIENFGVDKFNSECKKFALEQAQHMNNDFKRMGVWLDYEDPYMALTNDYMEGQWWFIKKAFNDGRIYEGERTVTWCKDCATALAKHELEYEEIKDTSIFVRFKIKNKENEYLAIWTTTPWTIPFNLAVMVNPELDYVKCKVDGNFYIVAKALVGPFVQAVLNEKLEIIQEFKGKDLEGIEYEHPFADQISAYNEIKKKAHKTHTVILSHEYVDTTAGTGLVHCAPGCGPEDYEIGHRNGLPPFNNISQTGVFPESMGDFKNLVAKTDDKIFIQALKNRNALLETSVVEHDYAHCWRCHHPVIFRTTKQWFLKSEDIIDKIIENNKSVNWIPKESSEQFDLWIKNLRDNSITRQRYWGTPVPIWRCNDCKNIEVIGSAKELEEKSGKTLTDLHKPYIDEVTFTCECGKEMKRIPDVMDVWLDAGSAAWNCFYYPKEEKYFKENFPADIIIEAKEQIRLWFYMLSLNSEIAFNKNAYKNVYCTGMLLAVGGEKMSKSLGNIISPNEIIDKHGSDTLRSYLCSIKAGLNMSFSWEEIKNKSKNLGVLWNLHNLLLEMGKNKNPTELDESLLKNALGYEEKYILSKTNSTIQKVTQLLDRYELDKALEPIEELFLELSRTYIQLVRDKASSGDDLDKEVVLYTIYNSLLASVKMLNIYCPFICEKIYQDFKTAFKLEDESINMSSWPVTNESLIDLELEQKIVAVKTTIQAILSAREKAQLGVRWPLKQAIIVTKDDKTISAVEDLADLIKVQTNVKELNVQQSFTHIEINIKADAGAIGREFGSLSPQIIIQIAQDSNESILSHIEKDGKYILKINNEKVEIKKNHLIIEREVKYPYQEAESRTGYVYINQERTEELENEGFSREIIRRIQAKRKKEGMSKEENIDLHIETDIAKGLLKYANQIAEKTGAKEISLTLPGQGVPGIQANDEQIKDKVFKIYFKRL